MTPTLNELLEKLNCAQRIESGEQVVEPPPPPVEPQTREGMPVLGQGPEPRKVRPIKSTEQFPNPPCIVQNLVNVSVCQGCPKNIDLTLPPPNDVFIRMKGIQPYKDKDTLMWIDQVKNIYLHLSLECMKNFDPTMDIATVTMSDEMFQHISDQHLAHPGMLGLLKHLITNKRKQVGLSNIKTFFFPKNFVWV